MSTPSTTAVRITRTDQTFLVALLSSVTQSRLFVRQVCSTWELDEAPIEIAALLVSELAANAIHASGVTEAHSVGGLVRADLQLIGVRLLECDASLVVEIWDTSPKPPVLLAPDDASEHGHGLQLVDALSAAWGHYDARMGGKVVWCQIGLDDAADTVGDPAASPSVIHALEAHAWNEQV